MNHTVKVSSPSLPDYDNHLKRVNDFVNEVAELPKPNLEELSSADKHYLDDFNKYKAEALTWTGFKNDLYNLPSSISSIGNPVDDDLSLIIQLEMKLIKAADPESIKKEIISTATEISTKVININDAIDKVLKSLNNFFNLYKNNNFGSLSGAVQQRSYWYRNQIERIDHMKPMEQAKHRVERNGYVKGQRTTEQWDREVFCFAGNCVANTKNDAQALIDYWSKEAKLFKNWKTSFDQLNIVAQPDKIDLIKMDNCQSTWRTKVYVDFSK